MSKAMTQVAFNEYGIIYGERISTTGSATSDSYLLPTNEIYSIGCTVSGLANIDFTFDDPDLVTPLWSRWDGLSQINKSARAWRVVSSGIAVANIVIKSVYL